MVISFQQQASKSAFPDEIVRKMPVGCDASIHYSWHGWSDGHAKSSDKESIRATDAAAQQQQHPHIAHVRLMTVLIDDLLEFIGEERKKTRPATSIPVSDETTKQSVKSKMHAAKPI